MRKIVYALVFGVALAGCGGSAASSLAPAALLPQSSSSGSPIKHVVIVIQENRSFDNLFDCFTGTDCVKYGKERVMQNGRWVDKRVTLFEQDLVPKANNIDIGHCYWSFIHAYDNGNMDGFNLDSKGVCPRNWPKPKNVKQIGTLAYNYINPSEITPYWDMAGQYVLADRMFQTQGSGSFTAHQDLIRGGTALGGTYGASPSMIDTPNVDPWGCDYVGSH
ncbi:MAG TPA: alkaline phosphatase family protein, partial [Candidatus Cybelea sp.]